VEKRERKTMIQPHKDISIEKQCALLSMPRSSFYHNAIDREDYDAVTHITETYQRFPVYGYRRITAELSRKGLAINKKKVLRIMKSQKLCAIYPGPKTTISDPKALKYPYLLRKMVITKPHAVWQIDITYLKTAHGFIYLTALIDVYSRYVVGHSLSNTLSTESCLLALERAILTHGIPGIVNSDQGVQFTSGLWIGMLQKRGITISMTGRGRSNDNAFIERLWRTLKYEWMFIYGANDVATYKSLLVTFVQWYNQERPHQALHYKTPSEMLAHDRAAPARGNVENCSVADIDVRQIVYHIPTGAAAAVLT